MNFFRKRWSFAFCLLILQFFSQKGFAQPGYWQQRVKYTMDIDMNVGNNRLIWETTARLHKSFS